MGTPVRLVMASKDFQGDDQQDKTRILLIDGHYVGVGGPVETPAMCFVFAVHVDDKGGEDGVRVCVGCWKMKSERVKDKKVGVGRYSCV